jgi:hypothetical protein
MKSHGILLGFLFMFIPELNKIVKVKLQVFPNYFSKQAFWQILIFMNRNSGHPAIRML